MPPLPFITLDNITVRLRDRWLLDNTSWQISRGQNWVIWGPNGAGKSTLAKVLLGYVAVVQGRVHRHYEKEFPPESARKAIALVSSEQYHNLYQRERLLDEMRHFSGRLDTVTSAGDLVGTPGDTLPPSGAGHGWLDIQEQLNLAGLLSKPIEALSSGEMRKLLIARALAAKPLLLIMDEPFNGLDANARQDLMEMMDQLAATGTQMVLITHRPSEIPGAFTHVLHLEEGQVVWQGAKIAFLDHLTQRGGQPKTQTSIASSPQIQSADRPGETLIEVHRATVRYNDTVVLDQVDWMVHAGENWALVGPNGAGKSTLLKLITGDNLQGYANKLVLFGHRKGAGQSVWEIKAHIGYVGDELQARYQKHMSGFDVVCSGFFDSVGLYRLATAEQKQAARQWIHRLELADLAEQPVTQLSFGQQRLILIARAMVKSPRLLILDEPCNGLDETHRARLLSLLDTIGRSSTANLLYVSHRSEEVPTCITHRLELAVGRVVKTQKL